MSDPDPTATGATGRERCPDCGSFHTEYERSDTSLNKRVVTCGDCDSTFTVYTGPECKHCGSNNTVKKRVGATPHRRQVIKCYECGENLTQVEADSLNLA